MAGGGAGIESGEPEFQIAPMIDVLLVLLVFFMSITSAEVLKVDKNLKLPVSPNAKKRETAEMKHEAALNARWKDNKVTISMDERPFDDREKLVQLLKDKLKADPKLRVVIRGDCALPAIELQRIMDNIGQAGIADVSFAATNKESAGTKK